MGSVNIGPVGVWNSLPMLEVWLWTNPSVLMLQDTRIGQSARARQAKEAQENEALRKQEKKESKKRGADAATYTIVVENLPKEANEGMLMLVFQRFPGLKEVRMDPGGESARVEYDNEEGAEAAVAGLQGFKLSTNKAMRLRKA